MNDQEDDALEIRPIGRTRPRREAIARAQAIYREDQPLSHDELRERLYNQLVRGGTHDEAAPILRPLNTFMKEAATRDVARRLFRSVAQIAERNMLGSLPNPDFRVWSAIYSRTFRWGKIAERITYDQFTHGIRVADKRSDLLRTENGDVVFAGSGVKSPAAVSQSLKNLLVGGYISRLDFHVGNVAASAFTPVPMFLLTDRLLEICEQSSHLIMELADMVEHVSSGWQSVETLPSTHPFSPLMRFESETQKRRIILDEDGDPAVPNKSGGYTKLFMVKGRL
jgi:hypothetical protein